MQLILPDAPLDLVSVDYYGPLPTARGGFKYLVVFLDVFSKFVRLYPLRRATTVVTLTRLTKDFIPSVGKPACIISDHGAQFTLKVWAEELKNHDIKPIFSSIRHPQSNPVERVNREISRILRTLTNVEHSAWVRYVPVIETYCNELYHHSTGYTPLELLKKTYPNRPWDKWIGNSTERECRDIPPEFKLQLARENMRKKGLRRQERANAGRTAYPYNVGDYVLIKANPISSAADREIAKFFDLYDGPYILSQKKGVATFELRYPETGTSRGTFHVSNLRPYRQRLAIEGQPTQQRDGAQASDGSRDEQTSRGDIPPP
ncbi:KRAB-A domain-containing protein 2-like [Osmia lignaria lignaria]|uniref:KRAB-A domain-containing protein 2-like n=1 Tax=Osmia lignaria lignaria TaxID=1437193 RepID=UPI00402BC9A9